MPDQCTSDIPREWNNRAASRSLQIFRQIDREQEHNARLRANDLPADGRPPDHDKRRVVAGVRLCCKRRNRGQNGTTYSEAEIFMIRDEVTAAPFYTGRQSVFFAAVEAQDVPFFHTVPKFFKTLAVTLQ